MEQCFKEGYDGPTLKKRFHFTKVPRDYSITKMFFMDQSSRYYFPCANTLDVAFDGLTVTRSLP